MGSDISLTFQNFSHIDLIDTLVEAPDDCLTTIKTQPSKGSTLKAFVGADTIAWDHPTTGLNVIGESVTALMYKNPQTGNLFGVAIRTYAQVFGIGAAPVWEVYYKGTSWKKVVDPSVIWELPEDAAKDLGLHVRVEPSASHQNLKLIVLITDEKKTDKTKPPKV